MAQLCAGETAAHLVRLIQVITPRQSFFRNAIFESLLERLSARYRSSLRQRESAYYVCLFHFRVLQAFLEHLEPLLAGASQALRNSVALICWQAFFDAEPEPIQLFSEKRFLADSRHFSGEIYNFWSWQYIYRNQECQKLRAALEPFLHGSGPISIVPCVPVSNLKEYQTITGRLKTGDGLGQELFAACNQAIGSARVMPHGARWRDARYKRPATENSSSPSALLTVLPLSSRRNNACTAPSSTRSAKEVPRPVQRIRMR